jgi:phosphoglycerate kinase
MKKTVKDVDIANRKVLVRVDFNVPLDAQGRITSDSRIRATLPTIRYLLDKGASVVLCSHLGRPGGKRVDGLSLRIAAHRLSKLLDQPVEIAPDCIGSEVQKMANTLKKGAILMLENLRFHPEEKGNDNSFAQALASLADIYVNDAFGASHRAHASIVGIPKYLPAVSGLLLEREIKTLGNILENPDRPFVGLFGGAKVSDKVATLENLINKLDYLLIGGAMAALFLKAKGYEIGESETELDQVDTAKSLMEKMTGAGARVTLPVDLVVAESIDSNANMETVSAEHISSNMKIVDIGPQTMRDFQEKLRDCRTILWNGPMGIYEVPLFAIGTKGIANYLAELEATTIVAGGSTADVIDDLALADRMTFVSTGGGAALEYLAGASLPGIEALPDA